jgi:hypothetical protein
VDDRIFFGLLCWVMAGMLLLLRFGSRWASAQQRRSGAFRSAEYWKGARRRATVGAVALALIGAVSLVLGLASL